MTMTVRILVEIIPDPPKNIDEILEIFDDSIYDSHNKYESTKDIKHFNQAVNWMIEDITNSEAPLKLQYITSLFRYFSRYKKNIFKNKDFLEITLKKAHDYLRYYKPEFYTTYTIIHDEMYDVLQNFLYEIKDLREIEAIKQKEKDYLEYCKLLNIDPDYDKKYWERYPPST